MKKLMQWVMAATRLLVLTMGPLVLTMGPLVLTMVFCSNMVLTSCSDKDETATQIQDKAYTGVPLVIFDTDIGSSADDLFALEMLYRYDEQQLCQLLGVVVDREGETNADFADVMNTYFGHPDVPIGLVQDGIKNPKVWIDYAHVAYMTEADDTTPMFLRTIDQNEMRPDGYKLYRRLLAQQPDHSVSIVSTGFVTCLAQLLQSEADEYSALSGVELVHQKVKCIYLQGGVFGDAEESDFNFAQGITFAQAFFDLWPKDVDMVFSPMELCVSFRPWRVIRSSHSANVAPSALRRRLIPSLPRLPQETCATSCQATLSGLP